MARPVGPDRLDRLERLEPTSGQPVVPGRREPPVPLEPAVRGVPEDLEISDLSVFQDGQAIPELQASLAWRSARQEIRVPPVWWERQDPAARLDSLVLLDPWVRQGHPD